MNWVGGKLGLSAHLWQNLKIQSTTKNPARLILLLKNIVIIPMSDNQQ